MDFECMKDFIAAEPTILVAPVDLGATVPYSSVGRSHGDSDGRNRRYRAQLLIRSMDAGKYLRVLH